MRMGMLKIQITSAAPFDFLWEIAKENIPVTDVKMLDALSVQLTVSAKYYGRLEKLTRRKHAELVIIQNLDISAIVKSKLKRPIMILGILLWISLLIYLPGKVLFVQVIGNSRISEQLILDKAEECGVVFGAERRELRSEKIKNALLSKIPELQWVGVNTRGCLAVITVEERSLPSHEQDRALVGHIVAIRDGVISSMVSTKGTSLCRPGQAVTKGQLLVSGYTDGGFALRAEIAAAEVMAITERTLTASSLQNSIMRGEIIHTRTEYSIQIGKNVVQLTNRGRSNDNSCVKIYETDILTLPGGFELPIALIRETYIQYTQKEESNFLQEEITEIADAYVTQQMLMGRIISANYHAKTINDLCELNCIYICEELIGILRKEEIMK